MVRTGQNQCQVIRYLDKRSHVPENVCKVHLVMALVPTRQKIFSESLGPHGWGIRRTVSWSHSRILHSGVGCSGHSGSGAVVHTRRSGSR